MADEITAGQALIELRATSDKLTADMAAVSKLITGELAKVEKEAANVGMAGLAKQIEDVAKATQAAQSQIQNLRFGAIADEVGQLTSALKGAESGVQVTEDLARAESLLEERFAMVRAEIQRAAEAQKGLVDEEVLAARTTLQLEAAERQHDQALGAVRTKALQAAQAISKLEDEERANAAAATKSWEATAKLAIEQQQAYEKAWQSVGKLAQEQEEAEQAARDLARWEAELATQNKEVAATGRTAVDSLREMQGTLTGAGIALSAFSAAGIVAIRDAVGALQEFERELGAVDTLLVGETSVSVGLLRRELLALDDRLGSAKDLTNALYQALSAGVEPAKGVEFVGEAAKLASAGLGNLTGTVDLLTTILNAYGIEASHAGEVSEVLFEAVKVGKTTIEELAGSMGRVIPTAKGLGVGVNDLSAVIAKLTTVGLNTDTAVTSLNAALVALQSPTTEAEKAASELGISFDQLRQVVRERGLVAALVEIQKATGGNQQAIAKLIPAIEAQRAVFALMSGDVSKLNGFLADFTKEAGAGGQVASAFEARAKTLDGAMAALAVSVEKAQINIATGLKVSLLDASDAARKALDDFNKLSGESQALAAQMGAITVGVAGAAGASLLFLSRLPDMIQGFDILNKIVPLSVGSTTAWGLSAAGAATGITIVGSAAILAGKTILDLSVDINEARAQNERLLESFQRLPPALREAQAASGGVAIELGKQRDALAGVEEEIARLRIQTENGNRATTSSGESLADMEAKATRLRDTIAALEGTLEKANRQLAASGAIAQDTGSQFDAMLDSWRAWKVVAQDTGSQFDAMLINWEDANKAAEEAKRAQKEAAAEAKRLSDVNRGLADSIEQLKLDALSDDLDDATAALERNRSVVADESYLRALQDIQAAYESQVETIKRTTEEAVAAGADRTLAAEREALAVESAQRDMAQAVAKLDVVLVENAGTWDDLGAELAKLPPELSVISPQFAALGVATGHATLATFGLTEATKEVSPAAEAASGTISDLSKAIVGLIDGTTDAGDVMQAFAGGLVDNLGGAVSGALKSSSFGKDLTSSLSGVFGPALGEAVATAGMSAVVQVGAGIFMSGVKDALEGEATSAAAKIGLVVGGPIGAAIGVGIVAAFGIGQQSMVEQIAAQLGEMFKASFKADAVVQAINDGLVEVGSFLGPGLETLMIRAPKDMGAQVTEAWKALGTDSAHEFSEGFYQDMKEKGKQLIHSSIADVLHVLFPQIAKDLEVGIQQSAVAAGSAIAAEMGLLGDKAIKFAQQWGIAFIGMAQKAGLSADEILTALHRIDTSLGTSQELVGALQRLQAALIDSGEDVDLLFQKINEQLKTITGKKVKVGNLDEVLAAVGGDATRALGVIENGMEMAGISIEKFTGQLSDVVLAISNDAGTAIREAGEDFRRFGNEADGTAGILREKVLSALDDVIKTAEELGYSTESIDAFKTAVGLIPPEMLRSSEFVNALREDFARMAVESHMSVQELVDSIDPPLPEATRNAILAVNDLGKAIGDLTGAPLKNLKEVTDRMQQFAGEMYQVARDENGKIKEENGKAVMELTAFGQELVNEAVSAISGMWSQMNEDGWVGLDEVGVMFDQLALLPVEAMNDPAIQQATRDLLAKIGAMTGDAAIIAMANAETITQDMIDQGLAAYEEYKKEIEENPPEVPPPTTPDGQPTTDPTQDPTAAATGAPPPQPIPPETTASYQTLADTATEYAKAVLAGQDAVEALATTTVEASARMLESLRPLIGTPDDGVGLAAIEDMIARRLIEALEVAKEGTLGATGVIHDSFDYARGAVLMLTDAINAIPRDITTTVHVVQDGSANVTPVEIPTSHTGELIPGMPGEETLRILEAGELVIPADAVAAMGRGAFDLPASMVSRLSYPVGVPSMASVAGAGAAASTPALDPEWTALPVRKRDLIEGAVLEVARATETGRARIDGRRFRVSPTYGRSRG